MQNFESIEDTVSIESILKEMSILKSILTCCRISEKQKSVLGELSYNLGQIFSADVSDAFPWKLSMTVRRVTQCFLTLQNNHSV